MSLILWTSYHEISVWQDVFSGLGFQLPGQNALGLFGILVLQAISGTLTDMESLWMQAETNSSVVSSSAKDEQLSSAPLISLEMSHLI